MTSFDATEYKRQQERTWTALAGAWRRWAEMFEDGARPANTRLLELGGVGPGQRVLDLATGLGQPALSAAARVGPTGRVVGVDQSGEMLAIARQDAAAAGLSNVEFIQSDAEVLAVDGPFDVVLSRWGLMFFPDVEGVLRRSHALLAPGGRIAAAVWSTPDRVPIIALTFGVIARFLGLPPPPPSMPSPFSLASPGALAAMLERVGFAAIQSEEMDLPFALPAADTYMKYSWDVLPPFAKAQVDALEPSRRDELWRAIGEATRAYAAPSGELRLISRAILVAGAKTGAAP